MKNSKAYFLVLTLLTVAIFYFTVPAWYGKKIEKGGKLTALAELRSFDVDVHTIGELEAMQSTNITSALKGDLGKIIFIVSDGKSVLAGDSLIKMDPTPFEEQIEELKRLISEQEAKIFALEQMAKWDNEQIEHEEKAGLIEIEAAKLEVNKVVYADGPAEEARLKSAMQKSFSKYNELLSFVADLNSLQAQDFLNPVELKQAQDKFAEEEENYLSAKQLYENFIMHAQPMQIKKAEIALKRCMNKFEETLKAGAFKIAKAQSQLAQAAQELHDLQQQLKKAEQQMSLTEIKAPTPGMVVLREEFRNGQRRKPRLGDIAIRNQPILDLPDLETMLVKTKVREIDLYKISVGTSGTVEVDAYPELRFQGKVQSIGVLAVSDPGRTGDEKYFDVIVKLDSSDSRLRPGMTARVDLHSCRVENKRSVPIQAVFEFDKQYYCFVDEDHSYTAVPIELGASNGLWIEITAGLERNVPVLLSMPAWSDVGNAHEVREGCHDCG